MEKLREQYSLLNKRLKKQESLGEGAVVAFAKKNIAKTYKLNNIYIAVLMFFILLYAVAYYICKCSISYAVYVDGYLLLCCVFAYYCSFKIGDVDKHACDKGVINGLQRRVKLVKKLCRLYSLFLTIVALVWFYLTYRQFDVINLERQTLFVVTIVVNILGIILGYVRYYRVDKYTQRLTDEMQDLELQDWN